MEGNESVCAVTDVCPKQGAAFVLGKAEERSMLNPFGFGWPRIEHDALEETVCAEKGRVCRDLAALGAKLWAELLAASLGAMDYCDFWVYAQR